MIRTRKGNINAAILTVIAHALLIGGPWVGFQFGGVYGGAAAGLAAFYGLAFAVMHFEVDLR